MNSRNIFAAVALLANAVECNACARHIRSWRAFGTQSWTDPTHGIIYVLMISRDKLQPTPDDSRHAPRLSANRRWRA